MAPIELVLTGIILFPFRNPEEYESENSLFLVTMAIHRRSRVHRVIMIIELCTFSEIGARSGGSSMPWSFIRIKLACLFQHVSTCSYSTQIML